MNGREQVHVPCPPAQVDYQKHMGGVDLSDQLIETFSVVRKSRKPWKKLLGYGLEVSLPSWFFHYNEESKSPVLPGVDRLPNGSCLPADWTNVISSKIWSTPSFPVSEADEKRPNNRHVLEVTDTTRDCAVCAKKAIMQDLGKNFRYKLQIVRYLCQPVILKTDLDIADGLILKFCKAVESLYGTDVITQNMYLKEVILDHGPVTSFWCFSFKRFNGTISSTTTNKRSVDFQLMRKLLISRQLTEFVVNIAKQAPLHGVN